MSERVRRTGGAALILLLLLSTVEFLIVAMGTHQTLLSRFPRALAFTWPLIPIFVALNSREVNQLLSDDPRDQYAILITVLAVVNFATALAALAAMAGA